MWPIPFVVAAWLTVSPFPQQNDTTSVVLAEFSRFLNPIQLNEVSNYSLYSITNNHYVEIDSVFEIFVLEEDTVKAGSLIALVTTRLENKSEYIFRCSNLTDLNGVPLTVDSAWFYFNGYADNLFQTPIPVFSTDE